MDITLIAAFALSAALVITCIALLAARRGRAADPASLQLVAQLSGQMQAMAAAQAATQAAIDQRLARLSEGVQDRLTANASEAAASLGELKERLAVIDAAQKNIAELSTRMVSLQDVLSNKQARGAFGEVQLMDLVGSALAPAQYEMQATLSNGKRVDCLVKLPNPPGPIAIDAKFPLEAYRGLQDAKDDATLVVARREFSAAIRIHVKAIAEKYLIPGETAESALMFLPSEAVYGELHTNFQALVDEASRAKVWIVSPTTMMATLITLRAVLKDARMREQAHVIQAMVGDLMADLQRLDARVTKLQSHFDQAVEDVRQVRISTDKAIKKSARIEDVGLGETSADKTGPGDTSPGGIALTTEE